MVPVYGNPIMDLVTIVLLFEWLKKQMLFLSEFRGVERDPDLQQKGFRLQYGLKGKGNFIENLHCFNL